MCETAAKLEAQRRDVRLKERIKFLIEQNPELSPHQRECLRYIGGGYYFVASAYLSAWSLEVPETREYSTEDAVVRPNHYAKWNLEPTTWAREFNVNWNVANAVKYIFRFADKMKPREDLMKAVRYLDMERKFLSGEEGWSK